METGSEVDSNSADLRCDPTCHIRDMWSSLFSLSFLTLLVFLNLLIPALIGLIPRPSGPLTLSFWLDIPCLLSVFSADCNLKSHLRNLLIPFPFSRSFHCPWPLPFASTFLHIIDLIFLIIDIELVDTAIVLRGGVFEKVDENRVNLRLCCWILTVTFNVWIRFSLTFWSARVIFIMSVPHTLRWWVPSNDDIAEAHPWIFFEFHSISIMVCSRRLTVQVFAESANWSVMWRQISKPVTAPDSAPEACMIEFRPTRTFGSPVVGWRKSSLQNICLEQLWFFLLHSVFEFEILSSDWCDHLCIICSLSCGDVFVLIWQGSPEHDICFDDVFGLGGCWEEWYELLDRQWQPIMQWIFLTIPRRTAWVRQMI